jgi:hypothetical protein
MPAAAAAATKTTLGAAEALEAAVLALEKITQQPLLALLTLAAEEGGEATAFSAELREGLGLSLFDTLLQNPSIRRPRPQTGLSVDKEYSDGKQDLCRRRACLKL